MPPEGDDRMKLTMSLTLDGLIRALRLKEHSLAEKVEQTTRGAPVRSERSAGRRARDEHNDDRGR